MFHPPTRLSFVLFVFSLVVLVNPGRSPYIDPARGRDLGFLSWYSRLTEVVNPGRSPYTDPARGGDLGFLSSYSRRTETEAVPASATAQSDSGPQYVAVYQIQGAGSVSPLNQEWIDTFGVVTGVSSNGFYLQDPVGDGDAATSDGIFVYTQRAPNVSVGTCVQVRRAFVDEYYEKTELSRTKPIERSDRCLTTNVAPAVMEQAHPGVPPVAMFERYEGMVVELDDLRGLVQGATKRFRNGEAEVAFLPQQWVPLMDGERVFQWQREAVPALMYVSNALSRRRR